MGILMKNVRYNWNPNEKMCGTMGILTKNVRYNGNHHRTTPAGQSKHTIKIYNHTTKRIYLPKSASINRERTLQSHILIGLHWRSLFCRPVIVDTAENVPGKETWKGGAAPRRCFERPPKNEKSMNSCPLAREHLHNASLSTAFPWRCFYFQLPNAFKKMFAFR